MRSEDLIKVYPLPAHNVLNLQLPETYAGKAGTVHMYSLDGKLMQSARLKGTTSLTLNIDKLPAGVYSVRINIQGRTVSKVITVTK